jgi:hypothetical protein
MGDLRLKFLQSMNRILDPLPSPKSGRGRKPVMRLFFNAHFVVDRNNALYTSGEHQRAVDL